MKLSNVITTSAVAQRLCRCAAEHLTASLLRSHSSSISMWWNAKMPSALHTFAVSYYSPGLALKCKPYDSDEIFIAFINLKSSLNRKVYLVKHVVWQVGALYRQGHEGWDR